MTKYQHSKKGAWKEGKEQYVCHEIVNNSNNAALLTDRHVVVFDFKNNTSVVMSYSRAHFVENIIADKYYNRNIAM